MPELTANGVRFHVQRLGPRAAARDPAAPPPVVLLHGLVIDDLSSFYYTLAAPIAATGVEAVLYDQRGHGLSERPPTGYAVTDAVADLEAVLDGLGVSRAHLVGNSYGGVVALRFAMARPERVAGLVLLEAQVSAGPPGTSLEGMLNTLAAGALRLEHDGLVGPPGAPGERRRARFVRAADALLNHTTLIDDLAAMAPLTAADLAAVTCPVLAVYGERSELAASLAELVGGVGDCRVRMVPGLAHTVLIEATAFVREAVLSWLATVAPARPPVPGAA